MPKITNRSYYAARATAARRAAKSTPDVLVRDILSERAEQYDALANAVPTALATTNERTFLLKAQQGAAGDNPPPQDAIALMLADALPQMIWSAQAEGFHDYFNARWYAFTGAPEGSTDGSNWNDMFHTDDRRRASAAWQRSVETGQPFEIEYRLQYHAEGYRWTLGRALPMRDETGVITRWVGTCTDIDDLKRGEKANALLSSELSQSAALLQTVVEVVPGPIYAIDRRGRILFANKAALELIDTPMFEIEDALETARLGTGKQSKIILKNNQHAITNGAPLEFEEIIDQRGKGPRLFLSTKAPFFGSDKNVAGLISLSIDVTERQELAKELLHVSKRTAMGDMAAAIAHEINQPLAATSLYLEAAGALLRSDGDRDRVLQSLALAKDQCHRAGDIIKRVRSFVSGNEVVKCPENLTHLVDEACKLALIGCRENGITTTVVHHQTDAFVFVDRVQIEQVIMNLVRNAMDAIGDASAAEIHITTDKWLSDMALISVSDTGSGISPDVIDRIYEPFVSTKGQRGMGVGLSICRTIVEDHGGKIWAEPGETKGTRFCFTLPICGAG